MSWGKTLLLMSFLTALFLGIGYYFGGTGGMLFGLAFAGIMNFLTYWYSDRFVLWIYKAKPLDAKKHKNIEKMAERLADAAGVPKPRLYYLDIDTPNAFATGRSPAKGVVAVTKGLVEKLDDKEVEGVIAHEIAHIKNRDTLTQAMAATMAGAITYMGHLFLFGDRENRNALSYLLLFIAAPIAAMLIRMAISRSREYAADKTGAMISDPLGLASALQKIAGAAKEKPMRGNEATSHMFIINPFSAGGVAGLFSTHPPVEERIRRLKGMAR
ncbi:MAG: zinc metalloprotease HtpX [Candidatus Aenigmarchaeota archaeon]|nr:zinc metalloprotease HtpX [Candidatus Aenigmarchaeota archaeon]